MTLHLVSHISNQFCKMSWTQKCMRWFWLSLNFTWETFWHETSRDQMSLSSANAERSCKCETATLVTSTHEEESKQHREPILHVVLSVNCCCFHTQTFSMCIYKLPFHFRLVILCHCMICTIHYKFHGVKIKCIFFMWNVFLTQINVSVSLNKSVFIILWFSDNTAHDVLNENNRTSDYLTSWQQWFYENKDVLKQGITLHYNKQQL